MGAVTLGLMLSAPAGAVTGGSLLIRADARQAVPTATAVKTTARKRVRSCNKGDDRKHRASSPAVDAWAVACEFPPRSQSLPSAALQSTASIAAILSG